MKIRHKVPAHLLARSDPITPEYQAEIDRTMAHAEANWNRAQKRLESAQRRLARAQRRVAKEGKPRANEIAHLEAVVELRRVQMEQTHRLMVATGAPATSRGVKSFRPVPRPGGPL